MRKAFGVYFHSQTNSSYRLLIISVLFVVFCAQPFTLHGLLLIITLFSFCAVSVANINAILSLRMLDCVYTRTIEFTYNINKH